MWTDLLDLLLGGPCPGCGRPGGRGPCPGCLEALPSAPWPLSPGAPGAAATWVLAPYAGPVGACIRRAKYGASPAVLLPLGEQLARAVEALPAPDLVVPAPVGPRAAFERGFHHARLLAACVARRRRRPLVEALARRAGPQLAGLDPVARRAAVEGCVHARRRVAGTAWLVDDVLTTGATAGACARSLRAAGARSVVVLALASPRLAP